MRAPRWRHLRSWFRNLGAIALAAAEQLFSIFVILRTIGCDDISKLDNVEFIGDFAMQHRSIQELLMPAVYVCHMIREFPEPAAILHGSNLALSELELPGQYITVEQNLKCVANAMKLARSPEWYLPWGLRIAEYIHGPLTPALLTAPTLGDGLDVFFEYFGLRIPYMGIRARLGAGQLEIELTPLLDVGDLIAPLVEIPFLILQHYIGTVRAAPMREALVQLSYPPSASQAVYRKWFECELRFHAPRNVLSIPVAWRATPNLGYDEALWQAALQKCAELADTQTLRCPLSRIRAELQRMLNGMEAATTPPTLGEVTTDEHFTAHAHPPSARGGHHLSAGNRRHPPTARHRTPTPCERAPEQHCGCPRFRRCREFRQGFQTLDGRVAEHLPQVVYSQREVMINQHQH